jgi:CubicO group peptidase (beta-lactamase class C family)
MNTPFQAVCEAAALEWQVPALAAGSSVAGSEETAFVGCRPDDVFRVASLTKPVTALLATELLDLEAKTGVWPADVRVRHLLSHTSGYDGEFVERDLARFGDGDDALGAAVAGLPSIRRFLGVEQAFSYANTGFWLAGHLAAERAGVTYEDAVTERVLRPAGLESTSFGEPTLAGTGYDAGSGPYPRARRPSGGLASTLGDLLRLGRYLLAHPAAARMRIVHAKPNAGVYGLGLFGERVGGHEVWGHSGAYDGFRASLLTIPDLDAVFAGVTNSSVGNKALDLVEDAFFEEVTGARRRRAERLELPAEVLESYTGSYANSDGWYEVTNAVDGLVVTFEDGDFAGVPIGEATFEIVEGHRIRDRFDFPVEGFGRFGVRLAERVA